MKSEFFKKLTNLFKEAEMDVDVAASAEHPLKASSDKLGQAIAAYGDGAGLAADHPLHALKALHKEMNDVMASATAKAAADKEAAAKAAEPQGDEDDVTKANIQEEVSKALVDVNKALEAANKRADAAEALAKSNSDKMELEAEKTTLRKFKYVTVDAEKDAAIFAKMRATDRPTYDFMIAKLDAAEAIARKSNLLMADLGSPLGGEGQTAWAEIEAEAAKVIAKGAEGITQEKAIDQVMKSRPDLVKRYKAEQAGSPS